MKQILAVGNDHSLLYTRGLLLEKSGAAVTTITYEGALPLITGCAFRLLVLCHSLSDREVSDLCLAARGCTGKVNILLLETPGATLRVPVDVDGLIALDDGPQQFILTVESLLAEPEEWERDGSKAGATLVAFDDARKRAAHALCRGEGKPPVPTTHSLCPG